MPSKRKRTLLEALLEYRDAHPKFRKILDMLFELSDKFIVVYSIIALLIITIPVVAVYLTLPDDLRKEISGFLGGALSIIVIPVLLNQISKKSTSEQKRLELNFPLYKELSSKLTQLLKEKNFGDAEADIIGAFLKEHYYEMCLSFSSNLIWDIFAVYTECKKEVTSTDNIKYYSQKCFRAMRRHLGINQRFNLSKGIIDLL